MSALREVFARFGVDFNSGPLTAGSDAVNGLIGRLQTLGNVVAGAAVVRGIQAFASEFTNVADEIGDTSAALGMSTRALQEWRYAAELSGVASGQLDASFLRLQDQMAAGNPAFRRLGISVRDASGELRSAGDVLADLADPIAALPTDAERTGVLMDLLGRSGARMGPLFARGSEGIAELRTEFERLGGGVTDDAAEAAGAYDDALVRLDRATLGLKSRIAVFLLPALERMASALTEAGARLSAMTDRGRIAEVVIAAVGATAVVAGAETAAAWVAAAAPFVALAIVVGAALLIFEDLWVGMDGGRSTLADLGTEFEAWGETATGVLGGVATAIEVVKGLLLSTLQAFHDLTGLGVDFSGGDGDMAITNDPSAEGQAANAIVQERRAGLESRGLSEALIPDSVERFLAAREVLGGAGGAAGVLQGAAGAAAPRGAPQVTQTVRIDRIDTSGMTQAQAQVTIERAIERALTREAGDTLDALAQEG